MMINKFLLFSTIAFFAAPSIAQITHVEGTAPALYQNQISGDFQDEVIIVSTNPDGFLVITGGTGGRQKFALLAGHQLKDIKAALEKAGAWGITSAENQIETSKEIAMIQSEINEESSLEFEFTSRKQGSEYFVTMRFNSHLENRFVLCLNLKPEGITQFLALLDKVPETYRKALADKAKADALLR